MREILVFTVQSDIGFLSFVEAREGQLTLRVDALRPEGFPAWMLTEPVFFEYASVRIARLLTVPFIGAASYPICALLFKFLRFEGALLVINFSLLFLLPHPNDLRVAGVLTSTLVLAQLYGFNDVFDAPGDLHDPDKPRAIVEAICRKRTFFMSASVVWAIILVCISILWHPAIALAVGAMLITNALYSVLFKGIPILDVIVVILWGGLFPYVSGAPVSPRLAFTVGVMTGVSHVWQTMRDKTADEQRRIRTIAVFSHRWSVFIVFLLCLQLAGILFYSLPGVRSYLLAASAFLPLFFYFTFRSIRIVWLLSKILFSILWLALLLD